MYFTYVLSTHYVISVIGRKNRRIYLNINCTTEPWIKKRETLLVERLSSL